MYMHESGAPTTSLAFVSSDREGFDHVRYQWAASQKNKYEKKSLNLVSRLIGRIFPKERTRVKYIQYIQYIVLTISRYGALFQSVVRYFVLFRLISVYFALFRQSLVPQKGPH